MELDITNLPLDDAETYQLLASGNTSGVFQLESRGMRELLTRLKPSRFEDIIALNALYRPGPLGSGMIDDFIKRKHNPAPRQVRDASPEGGPGGDVRGHRLSGTDHADRHPRLPISPRARRMRSERR